MLKKTPGASLAGVSCSSVSFCLVSGTRLGSPVSVRTPVNLLTVWNGRSWHPRQAGADTAGPLSCVSPKFCMELGGTPLASQVQFWNGSGWRQSTACNAGPGCEFSTVACTNASACIAVGSVTTDDGHSLGGWQNAKPTCTIHCDISQPVSCSGPSFCASVDGRFLFSVVRNGTTWKAIQMAPIPGRHQSLSGLSCAKKTFCLAVGSYSANFGLAERWNGTNWQYVKTPVVG